MNIRTVILLVFYILLVIAVIPVLLICFVLGVREPLLGIGRWAMRVSRGLLGIHVDVVGLDQAKTNRPAVYMANHSSLLDGPLLFILIPRPPRIIIKAGVFRLPIVGWGMKYVGFVPVDRRGARAGRAAIDRAARLMREKGYSFLIFPEGTRSRDNRLQSFRRGGFFLALAAEAPIIPVTIQGTYALMPKGVSAPKRGSVRVIFHPAVSVEGRRPEDMADLMEAVRARIADSN